MSRKRTNKRKKTASKVDLVVGALIVFSILLTFLIYTKSGIVGVKLTEFLGGMIGAIRYVLPIGLFVVAIKLSAEGSTNFSSKIIQYGLILISLSILFSAFQISKGELQSSKELSEIVKDAYFVGSEGQGGGAIGTVAAVPLAKLLGDFGAIILCMGVVAVLIIFTFGINLSDIINNIVEKAQNKREDLISRMQDDELEESEIRESATERRKREREERIRQKELQKEQAKKTAMDNQIKINFGGRIVDAEEKSGLQKYEHGEDD